MIVSWIHQNFLRYFLWSFNQLISILVNYCMSLGFKKISQQHCFQLENNVQITLKFLQLQPLSQFISNICDFSWQPPKP